MYAVVRESTYAQGTQLEQTPQFDEFQRAHAERSGYRGTVVVQAADSHYITVTLWASKPDMDAAREALSPIVQRLLDPLMSAPSTLLASGPIVFRDLQN